MKCYFQIEEEWFKGEVVSMSGGTLVSFFSRNEENVIEAELTLGNPEILFHGPGMVVTGYEQIDRKAVQPTYKLTSVEVRWTKPKG